MTPFSCRKAYGRENLAFWPPADPPLVESAGEELGVLERGGLGVGRRLITVEHGLPPQRRIRRTGEFRFLGGRAKRFRTPHFVVLYYPSPVEEGSRLGMTVSRKVGKAVIRNRVKRRVREFFRLHWGRLRGAWKWVVIAYPGSGEMESKQIWEELLPVIDFLNRQGGSLRPRISPT